MITLPAPLEKVMQSQDLKGLKPFALLFRNKWDSVNNKFELEPNPIDISDMIAKPNTLSMTLDVSEIAQYNANNITLTLTDKDNRFVEGTPKSYFPAGYQLYGSKVILYYGLDVRNWTSLFVGVIKDLPTHKPEQYQVDLKLISPLELLNDIEAKEFSDKYIGESLTFVEVDDDGNYVYNTANTGVGGFNAVYADGNKLFEGIDYEVSQTNALGLPAIITIIKADYYSSTITADYYCWKTGLSVEQIVSGLVALGGYTSNTDIRSVVWNTAVRTVINPTINFSVGYYLQNTTTFGYKGSNVFYGTALAPSGKYYRHNTFPTNFKIEFSYSKTNFLSFYGIGEFVNGAVYNGYRLTLAWSNQFNNIIIFKIVNGAETQLANFSASNGLRIERRNGTFYFYSGNNSISDISSFADTEYNEYLTNEISNASHITLSGYILTDLDTNVSLNYEGIVFNSNQKNTPNDVWDRITFSLDNPNSTYLLDYRTSEDNITWENWQNITNGANIGSNSEYIQFRIMINSIAESTNIVNTQIEYLGSILVLQLVNLSGKSVLEALQDLALISGYEFGVDRNGIFFFRPRSQSTTPIFDLDESEIVKIDNIKQNFKDFFTKLTLTFAQIPLEFYANTGTRPTPVDKYGIINKEIDKPDIVNYDNPELAQAIGPQLLEVYSDLSDVIQCTAKLNLSLELGDIVNLKRNYNLTCDDNANDYTKFINQNTYYRACKITGINYNLSKRQMTYTLRDVSNENTRPQEEMYEFVYDFPIRLEPKY